MNTLLTTTIEMHLYSIVCTILKPLYSYYFIILITQWYYIIILNVNMVNNIFCKSVLIDNL